MSPLMSPPPLMLCPPALVSPYGGDKSLPCLNGLGKTLALNIRCHRFNEISEQSKRASAINVVGQGRASRKELSPTAQHPEEFISGLAHRFT